MAAMEQWCQGAPSPINTLEEYYEGQGGLSISGKKRADWQKFAEDVNNGEGAIDRLAGDNANYGMKEVAIDGLAGDEAYFDKYDVNMVESVKDNQDNDEIDDANRSQAVKDDKYNVALFEKDEHYRDWSDVPFPYKTEEEQ